jgi:peptide/nickel transport system permease protein
MLLATSAIIFLVLAFAPGDPLSDLALNPSVPPEVQDRIREDLGLNDPLPLQYVKWLRSLTLGSLGLGGVEPLVSFRSNTPVVDLILERLPRTIWISGTALVLAVVVALPIGVVSAVRQYSWFDQLATTFAFIGFSVPTFFTGLLFIIVFSIELGWLPFIYRSNLGEEGFGWVSAMLKQSVMPITVLALFQAATLTRFTRAAVLDNLALDYVRTARAKGLRERVVISRHVLRNALIPVVTIIALQVPYVVTGAIITEQIFQIPGVGRLLVESFFSSDTPVVMTITFMFAVFVVLSNLVADVLYGVLDPRIRYG